MCHSYSKGLEVNASDILEIDVFNFIFYRKSQLKKFSPNPSYVSQSLTQVS
jgi:hypothetical protein